MRLIYNIYQICIALPIFLVLTLLTAIVTIVGSRGIRHIPDLWLSGAQFQVDDEEEPA